MNIVFNSVYLLIYVFFIVQQSISMNFKVFLLIFVLPIFLSKYPPIFTDIFDISIKFKYRYIHNYRYFVPCLCDTVGKHTILFLPKIMARNISNRLYYGN